MPDRTAFIRSILALRDAGETGRISVHTDAGPTFVYLRDGVPIFAEEGTSGETLGRMLLRQQLITKEQYVDVLTKMTDVLVLNEQLRFGEVAIELGYLTEAQASAALADQVRWKIIRILQRSELEWTFDASQAFLDDVGNYPMQIEALVLEAVRWIDDDEKMEMGVRAALELRPVVDANAASRVARRFKLSREEETYLRSTDGRTIRSLLDEGHASLDVHALLTALVATRALELARPGRPAEPGQRSQQPPAGSMPPQRMQPIASAAPPKISEAPAKPTISAMPPRVGAAPVARFEAPSEPRIPASPPASASKIPVARFEAPSEPRIPASPPASASKIPLARPVTPAAPIALSRPQTPATPIALSRPATPIDPLLVSERTPAPAGSVPPRKPPMPTRASTLLRALAAQKVEASASRTPSTSHEAKLLAEQALQTGLTHLRAGRYDQALPDLQRAAQLQPSDEHKLYAKWCALRARSNEPPHPMELKEVDRIAQAALKADPNFAFGNYVSGSMALEDGDDQRARRLLQRAVKLDESLLDAQRQLRIVERRLGDGTKKKLW